MKRMEPTAADPDAVYDQEITVNVDEMPFVVAKPNKFGNVAPIAEVAGKKIDQAMIGSCANGRFEDIEIAARMLKGKKFMMACALFSRRLRNIFMRNA